MRKIFCEKPNVLPLFILITLCCSQVCWICFPSRSKDSQMKLQTIFWKLSDPMVPSLPLRNIEDGRPAEQTLISLCSISQSVACCGNVWVYAPSAGTVQTGRRANQPASLTWTRPCQLWSCREDEWMPSTLHCWDPPCAPSVALERGHNLLLSALMVPSVDARMAGLGVGAARWILPRAYCH